MAWENPVTSNPTVFRVFVVRSIDNAVMETFSTRTKDFVIVPVNGARSEVDKLGYENAYIATDNPEIAKQYGFKLIQDRYK